MNCETLMELASKWERDTVEPQCEDGSEQGKLHSAEARGHRKALARAADDLRTLVRLLGDAPMAANAVYGRAIAGAEQRRA